MRLPNTMVPFLTKYRKLLGVICLLITSICFAFVIKQAEIKGGVLIMLALLAPIIVVAVIGSPKFGTITLVIGAYLILWIIKMGLTTFPLGTVMDGLLGLLLLGLIIQQKYEANWDILKTPLSVIIIIWILYHFLQVINPSAESKMAWLYTVRSQAIVMLSYFIFIYNVRTVAFVRLIIQIWLGLSTFAALYCLKQQYVGFFGFEEAFLYSDPKIMELLFINGEWRKFSIFADPVTFSYNMVMGSLLCVGMLFSPGSRIKKTILFLLIPLFLFAMLLSGTRSAYILIPASVLMILVLKFNMKMLVIVGVVAVTFAGIILIPTSNPTLYRFQSAFKPSDDASFNVRTINQKRIQPYIQSHPMGGGLGATGQWGVKFSPGSFLSSFPPDSGYVRVAVEVGWIGLLILCTLIFVILKTGINNYFSIQDPELKGYCLSMVLIAFAIAIGNYPQEAITQYPSNVYFFMVAALTDILYRLDKEKSLKTIE